MNSRTIRVIILAILALALFMLILIVPRLGRAAIMALPPAPMPAAVTRTTARDAARQHDAAPTHTMMSLSVKSQQLAGACLHTPTP